MGGEADFSSVTPILRSGFPYGGERIRGEHMLAPFACPRQEQEARDPFGRATQGLMARGVRPYQGWRARRDERDPPTLAGGAEAE